MQPWSRAVVAEIVNGLADAAVPADVDPMEAYMRNQFRFLGVRAPAVRSVLRDAIAHVGHPIDEAEVVTAVDELWDRAGREHRYAGAALATAFAPKASPSFVADLARWITTEPWWDTCDVLARAGVGRVARAHPELRPTMDDWLDGDDRWLVRTAILHMGGWREAIDRTWVFAACLARADDEDFFIRKAIGWILRDLAWVDPAAVRAFVDGPGAVLSGLSRREALKNVLRADAR